MADERIIALVGATGAQGGGLGRAILGDGSSGFAARAIVRNTGSEKAGELARLGAEDIGRCALGVFMGGREFIGKIVGVGSPSVDVRTT